MPGPGEARELADGAAELGIDLEQPLLARLLRYLDLIYVWNRSAGLTTVKRGDAVRLHLLDCLPVAALIGSGRCVDLGSGAGLPGLVLAMLRPDLAVEMVESNRRKASFLMEVIRVEGIANAQVRECAVESLPVGEAWDCVVSRAFRHPPEFLSIAAPLVKPDGAILLMAADLDDGELEEMARRSGLVLDCTRRFRLPRGLEPRTLARFVRSS